jgi:hypothetical protein
MARNKATSRGGGVVIRRTQGRPDGTRTSLGKNATAKAIGGPTSSKASIPKKTTVVPRRIAD